MAEDAVEPLALHGGGGVLAGGLDEPDTPRDLGRLGRQRLAGPFEHGRRRVDDRHVVARPGQREALVAGPAAHVDDAAGRGRQHRSQVLADHVRAHPSPQRAVVAVDEPLGQRSPLVLGAVGRHGVARISPWRTANQPSGAAAQARQASAISAISAARGQPELDGLRGERGGLHAVGPQAAPPGPLVGVGEAPGRRGRRRRR